MNNAKRNALNSLADHIVRRCHVADPLHEVMHYVMSRTKHRAARRNPEARRELAHLLWCSRRAHRENRDIFASVMRGGRWSYVGVEVHGVHDQYENDTFEVYMTGGSNHSTATYLIGRVALVDGVPTFTPTNR